MTITRYYLVPGDDKKLLRFNILFKSIQYNTNPNRITEPRLGRLLFFPTNPGCLSLSGNPSSPTTNKLGQRCIYFHSDWTTDYEFLLMEIFQFFGRSD